METEQAIDLFSAESLSYFCTREAFKYHLNEPFNRKGWLAATNGRIMLIKSNNDAPDTVDEKRRRFPKIEDIAKDISKADSWTDWSYEPITRPFPYDVHCMYCKGDGYYDFEPCDVCNGEGEYTCEHCHSEVDCRFCKGDGGQGTLKCTTCHGNGNINSETAVREIAGRWFNRTYIERIEMYKPSKFTVIGEGDHAMLVAHCEECFIVVCQLKKQ
jgi:hypothetical protein